MRGRDNAAQPPGARRRVISVRSSLVIARRLAHRGRKLGAGFNLRRTAGSIFCDTVERCRRVGLDKGCRGSIIEPSLHKQLRVGGPPRHPLDRLRCRVALAVLSPGRVAVAAIAIACSINCLRQLELAGPYFLVRQRSPLPCWHSDRQAPGSSDLSPDRPLPSGPSNTSRLSRAARSRGIDTMCLARAFASCLREINHGSRPPSDIAGARMSPPWESERDRGVVPRWPRA